MLSSDVHMLKKQQKKIDLAKCFRNSTINLSGID